MLDGLPIYSSVDYCNVETGKGDIADGDVWSRVLELMQAGQSL